MDGAPLQRHRRARNWTQDQVADQLRQLGGKELGIDANAVSRHERGIIAMPRPPYPELYARLYRTTVAALWPGRMTGMERRQFLHAVAATPLAALLGADDPRAEAITAVPGGFRRLESTTAAADLGAPVTAHLRFIAGRLKHSGSQLAAAASEAAGLAAWLGVDQADHAAASRSFLASSLKVGVTRANDV
jgi:transcriptional regulator with XRE-family HTH domain